MKRLTFILFVIFFSCNQHAQIPNVENLKVSLTTKRFEQDFFSLDTNNLQKSLRSLSQNYPDFYPIFINHLLGLSMDNILVTGSNEQKALRQFIRDYTPVKTASNKLFGDFSKESEEIKSAFQFVKFYFPNYELPKNIITFIAPLDANFRTSFGIQGDILLERSVGIGLQLHLGKDFSLYQSSEGQALYPNFISANFDREHIVVNTMRNIVDDLYPSNATPHSLIEQMVNNGRRQYLLTKFMPRVKENIILGYTEKQYKEATENEALIWDFFLKNDLLNESELNLTKSYIMEGPNTPELGPNSPGNLGTFAGLQIVKKYMDKYPETTLDELMKMSEREIYSQSKYKPRL